MTLTSRPWEDSLLVTRRAGGGFRTRMSRGTSSVPFLGRATPAMEFAFERQAAAGIIMPVDLGKKQQLPQKAQFKP